MFLTNSVRRAALINARGVAAIQGCWQYSWSELAGRVARLAGSLVALGVRADDRVAILAANSPRYLEALYAIPWAGGVVVPLNHRFSCMGIERILEDAEAKVLFVDALTVNQCRPPGNIKHIVYMGDDRLPEDMMAYESLVTASVTPADDAARAVHETGAIFFTGGTTGEPKGVVLNHGNLMSNIMNCALEMGYQRNSRLIHVAPFFHIGAFSSLTALTMHAGTHVFMPRFDVDAYLATITRFGVTDLMLVPTMIAAILESSELERVDLTTVRSIAYGGSPISSALLARAQRVFPNAGFRQFYGLTELCASGTVLRPEHHQVPERLLSAGQPMFSVELRIIDPQDGIPVALGNVGEITVRSPGVMQGYWRRPDLTNDAIHDGWLHTGDLGYLDEAGFLYVVDRLKDMIVTGGENVYSAEVDHVLSQHPSVLECATIGIPDEKWGETVCAIVVTKPDVFLIEEELISHCRERLGVYQCPRKVIFRKDRLPVNRAGKVLKHSLRQEYARQANERHC
jgi:acyl-CoA synthetase (AMP-forming)/AMP-acid ligase II